MASNVVRGKDIRGRSDEELRVLVREKREELFKLRFQQFTGQLENVARLRQVRREIARALTHMAEKARSAQS